MKKSINLVATQGKFEVELIGDSIDVSLTKDGLSAQMSSFLYTDGPSLIYFFKDLAKSWKGWEGQKRWNTLESDVILTATHDGIGHVALLVELNNQENEESSWEASGTLLIELGSLDAWAKNIESLFS